MLTVISSYELGSHTPSNAPAAASPLPYASKIAKETRQVGPEQQVDLYTRHLHTHPTHA